MLPWLAPRSLAGNSPAEMRILLAPSNIANQAALQAAALRARGHEAECWHFGENPFGYSHERDLAWPESASEALTLLAEVAARDFDVMHLHFGRSLVSNTNPLGELWDLPLWRRLNVQLIMSLHGTDSRDANLERELDRWSYYHFGAPHHPPELIARRLAVIRANVDAMTVSAGSNFNHVPDANYLPLAIDTDAIQPTQAPTREVPVIAHAPSRRSTKGTDFILAGLDALRAEGVQFEVDLIEGVSNADVVSRLGNADIVIEKVLGDGYGVTTLEAFAAGKVVVTRVTERATAYAPGFPGVAADPESLTAKLRELVASPQLRAELGAKSRQFAVEHHGLAAVGSALEGLYAGTDVVRPKVTVDEGSLALAEEAAALRTRNRQLSQATREASAAAAEEREERQRVERTFGYRAQRRLRRAVDRKPR